MIHKQFGRTNLQVPSIGQGLNIADSRRTIVPESQVDLIRLGGMLGLTLLDTAPSYGSGSSEELAGDAIRGRRQEFFVATKVPPQHATAKGLPDAANSSLARLKTSWIDLYQVHWPNPRVPLAETMQAMEALVKSGKVRYIGVSNFSLRELKEARQALSTEDVSAIQVEYNLFDRGVESGLLEYCAHERITLIAYSPLDQGRLANGAAQRQFLQNVAARYGRTPGQIALRWLISHAPAIAIPNTTSADRMRENALAASFDLSPKDLAEIDRVCRSEPVDVPTQSIRPSSDHGRAVYLTVEDAIRNPLGFVPSPVELADQIKSGEFLKPIRLVELDDPAGKYRYDLIEGRVRYWAWVIAHGGAVPIPALVRVGPGRG